MPYYLGIDGGGSKTACAVADDGAILATAASGPSNMVRVGEARARESLHACVQQACAATGIAPGQIEYACIGAAGAARMEIAEAVRSVLAEILSCPIEVLGDMQIALEAAFNAGSGVIVVAGTGSIAYGRNAEGVTARSGGQGAATSDEGSGHWIGKQAIAVVMASAKNDAQAAEGVSADFLLPLQQAWGVASPAELIQIAKAQPAPDFAALFPAVLAAADSGNQLANKILRDAGKELARLAIEVMRQLFGEKEVLTAFSKFASAETNVVPVGMVGGVFRHAPIVREVFYNRVREFDERVEVRREVVDPIEGALRIARKAAQPGRSS